jgi:hypothetical protein
MSRDNYKVYCSCDSCKKNAEVRDTGYTPKGWYKLKVDSYSQESSSADSYWSVILCDECLVIGNKEANVKSTNLFSWLGGFLKKR